MSTDLPTQLPLQVGKAKDEQEKSNTVCYEHPVDEQTRVCLRLELLFTQIQHFILRPAFFDSHAALSGIIDILNILDRPDIKTRLIQEFKRHHRSLRGLEGNSQINQVILRATLRELGSLIDDLHSTQGRLGQALRDNEFLNHIRQHLLTPGGTTSSDTAGYFYWQQRSPMDRRHDLQHWLQQLEFVRDAVNTLLRLVRQSSQSKLVTAESGFYQESLSQRQRCKLIQVILPNNLPVYPEISAGRHRLSVHFYEPNIEQRPCRSRRDISFELNCCCL